MCEECAPSVSVFVLLGCSGFGESFGCVDETVSNNIQDVVSLGSGLMCNDDAVCGGRMDLNIVMRDLSDRRKYLESEYAMMLLVHLMFWEYRDTSLLTRFHPRH